MQRGAQQQLGDGVARAPSRAPARLVAFGLALASAALYAPALGFELVSFDDEKYLLRNPALREGLTLHALAWALRTDYFSNWHPLTWLSYLLDLQLFGPSAAGHHFVNLLLHAASAGLFCAGLSRASGRLGASAFAAALFALHPLRVESVAWVSQRKDVLSLLLGLCAIGAYLGWVRRGGRARYAGVLALFAAGLAAKPVLVTLPLLLLLLDRWPLARWGGGAGAARALPPARLVLEKLPLFALSLASGAITLFVQSGARAAAPEEQIPPALRGLNAVYSLARYLAKTLWPADLSVYYLHPYLPGGEPPGIGVWLGVALLLGLATAAAWRCRAAGPAWVGWLWFCVALVPNLGLVQVGMQGMADRYSYLPSLGLCTALGFGAADLAQRWLGARGARAAALALLALLAAATARQLETWRSSESLFAQALAVEPRNWLAHGHLAQLRLAARDYDAAAAHLRAALAEAPHLARSWHALGLAEAQRGQPAAAIEAYQRAVALEPGHMKAQRALAELLHAAGRRAEALAHREAAVEAAPRNHRARLELGLALLESGRPARAREELARARARSLELGDAEAAERAREGLERAQRAQGAPAPEALPPRPPPTHSSR